MQILQGLQNRTMLAGEQQLVLDKANLPPLSDLFPIIEKSIVKLHHLSNFDLLCMPYK